MTDAAGAGKDGARVQGDCRLAGAPPAIRRTVVRQRVTRPQASASFNVVRAIESQEGRRVAQWRRRIPLVLERAGAPGTDRSPIQRTAWHGSASDPSCQISIALDFAFIARLGLGFGDCNVTYIFESLRWMGKPDASRATPRGLLGIQLPWHEAMS